MPPSLRIEYPGAWYHVICRGNARMSIFREDLDKELLVACLVHFAELFRIKSRRESTQQRQLSSWLPLESVIAVVRIAYGCGTEQLLCRYNRDFEARQVLLSLAATHCRGRY